MQWLIEENVFGAREYRWSEKIKRQFKFRKADIAWLDSGEVLKSRLNGGTDFYVVTGYEQKDAAVMDSMVCPKCEGRTYARPGRAKDTRATGMWEHPCEMCKAWGTVPIKKGKLA